MGRGFKSRSTHHTRPLGEMVTTADSKSAAGDGLSVRVRQGPPHKESKLPYESLTTQEKLSIQAFYDVCRLLLNEGVTTKIAAQKSFEECIHGFTKEHAWRPTHISRAAAVALVEGDTRLVQRAHGALVGRLDRAERTMKVLTGPREEIDVWWPKYRENDQTILLTKVEHNSKKMFTESELIVLPHISRGMFVASGFSFKCRKGIEVEWLRDALGR